MATQDFRNDSSLPEKWKKRFAFFEQFGAPNAPAYKEELKKLEWKQRVLINANIWAFFFGPIYMAIIGLWKKALVLFGGILVIDTIAVALHLPGPVLNGVGIGFGVLCALCTNYAFYLKRVKGQDGWNPFEGMRM